MRRFFLFLSIIPLVPVFAQFLPVARDSITVIENNYVLKMPWANGINHSNVSALDLNFDNKKDIVVFDRVNGYGNGRFRCFINVGAPGEIRYRAEPQLSYYFPHVLYWAIFKDYNGDGKEDLFCSTSGGIRVYKNTSTPQNVLQFTLVKNLLYSDYGSPTPGNLYASSVGLPGIADIDGDGDLDILTFSTLGVSVEFHKNISKENNWSPDSLRYQLADYCWGDISESDCSVNFIECPVRKAWDSLTMPADPYHSGACLTCLDSDGDGDQDLIIADVVCSTVQYVHNTGTPAQASLTDTTRLYPNFPAKNQNGTHIKMNIFPCTYNVDADGDNINDLVATPNVFGTENYKSIWLYRNASTTPTANFQFVKNNFLQDEMIEVGQNSYPVLFDYNADGKKDLLIGNYGYYINGSQRPRLTLYENVGTLSQPVFSLVTRDYGGLSAQSINHAMPAVGDIDNDGDMDILIGTSSGQIHWLENTAGAGNISNFSVFKNNPFAFTTISAAAAPQLFDLDNDGKLDLLIGMKNGHIAYYRNTGSSGVPSYSLVTNTLGGVDVKGDPTQYGSDGFAVPFFYREAGNIKLMAGSVSGLIFLYDVPSITAPFVLVSGNAGFNEGGQSTAWFEDINNDNKRDLFIGNASGGLSFFSSNSPFVGVPGEMATAFPEVWVFPNPASNRLSVRTDLAQFKNGEAILFDAQGRMIRTIAIKEGLQTVDIKDLETGLYFIKLALCSESRIYHVTRKFIKE